MRAVLEMGVLENMPVAGSISAKDLANGVGAEEILISQSQRLCPSKFERMFSMTPKLVSSPLDEDTHSYWHIQRVRPKSICSHAILTGLS